MGTLETTGLFGIFHCFTCNSLSMCSVYLDRKAAQPIYTVCDNCYQSPVGKKILGAVNV